MHLGVQSGEARLSVGEVTRRRSTAHHRERTSSIVVRMLLGVGAFAWAALILGSAVRNISRDPYWPAYLVGGGLFGAAATLVTRDAGRRSLGRFLAMLTYVSIGCIVTILVPPSDSDVYIESLPVEKFVALTQFLIPLWLFLSSRAGRHGTERPDQYEDVFE